MIRRPPRSTLSPSSAASDVYKRQIKGTDESSYKNLIDALDEMQICNISRYAIVDITDGDKFLLDNYEQKGELTRNIDR